VVRRFGQQNVGRFEVPVDDVLGLQKLEPVGDLLEKHVRHGLVDASPFFDEFGQVPPRAEFQHQVDVPRGGKMLEQTHNVPVQVVAHDRNLLVQVLHQFRVPDFFCGVHGAVEIE
jgi:hypothetical protein